MIKIIKQGNRHRRIKRIYEHECIVCGCMFEYEYEDVEQTFGYKDCAIQCPCCKTTLGVLLDQENYRLEEKEN